jgi:hypothetical protein
MTRHVHEERATRVDAGAIDFQRLPGRAGSPLEFVPNLDVYLEHAMCSCNASDDNPY